MLNIIKVMAIIALFNGKSAVDSRINYEEEVPQDNWWEHDNANCDMYGCYGGYVLDNIPSEYNPNYYENLDFAWAAASVGGGFQPSVSNDTGGGYWGDYYDTPVWNGNQTISIGGYSASMVVGSGQSIVYGAGTAALMGIEGKTVIADHASQGFRAMESNDYATISGLRYRKVNTRYGTNTGEGIYLDDGTFFTDVPTGDVITYTCIDTVGDRVVVVYWEPCDDSQTVASPEATSFETPASYPESYDVSASVKTSTVKHVMPTEAQRQHYLEKVMELGMH